MGELRKGPMLAPVTAGSPHHGYPRQHSSSSHCSTGAAVPGVQFYCSAVLLSYCSTGAAVPAVLLFCCSTVLLELQCLVCSSTVLLFYCFTVLLELQCLVCSSTVLLFYCSTATAVLGELHMGPSKKGIVSEIRTRNSGVKRIHLC